MGIFGELHLFLPYTLFSTNALAFICCCYMTMITTASDSALMLVCMPTLNQIIANPGDAQVLKNYFQTHKDPSFPCGQKFLIK